MLSVQVHKYDIDGEGGVSFSEVSSASLISRSYYAANTHIQNADVNFNCLPGIGKTFLICLFTLFLPDLKYRNSDLYVIYRKDDGVIVLENKENEANPLNSFASLELCLNE